MKFNAHINPFIKKLFIYFIGVFSTKILSLLLVPIYAYFVDEEALGNYDYLVAIVSVVAPLIYVSLWEAVLKWCLNSKEDNLIEKEKIISNVVIYFILSSIAVIFLFLAAFFIFSLDTKYLFSIIFFVLYGATSLWQFSARALHENKIYVVSSIVGSATLIFVDLFFIFTATLDFFGLCLAYSLSQFIVFVLIEIKLKLLLKIKMALFDKNLLIKMIVFCFPLALNAVSLWAYTSGSKIIIQNYIGASENGLYSFASKFSLLISLFSSVFSMAIIEDAYSYTSLEIYKEKMNKIIGLISKSYFALIYLALPAIYLLYELAFKNTSYYGSAEFIFFLLLTALFTALSNNFGSAFQITNKTNYILYTTIAGAVSSIVISLVLVQFIGIYGVLIGGAVGPFVMMLIRALYAYKTTGLRIKWGCSLLFLFLSFAEWICCKLYSDILIQIFMLAFALIVIAFCFKSELTFMLKKWRKKK